MFNRGLKKLVNSDSDSNESSDFTETKVNRKVNIRPANLTLVENTNIEPINTAKASISDIKDYIETISVFK